MHAFAGDSAFDYKAILFLFYCYGRRIICFGNLHYGRKVPLDCYFETISGCNSRMSDFVLVFLQFVPACSCEKNPDYS